METEDVDHAKKKLETEITNKHSDSSLEDSSREQNLGK